MYILHQGVYQSAQDKTFCVLARAMKECGATVTKCVVMAKEEEREQTFFLPLVHVTVVLYSLYIQSLCLQVLVYISLYVKTEAPKRS